MNVLPLSRFTPRSSLPHFCHTCRCPSQQPFFNKSYRSLMPRLLQTLIKDVLKPSLNIFTLMARAPPSKSTSTSISPCKAQHR